MLTSELCNAVDEAVVPRQEGTSKRRFEIQDAESNPQNQDGDGR